MSPLPAETPPPARGVQMRAARLLRRRREIGGLWHEDVAIWASEPSPIRVAGPAVSQGVKDLVVGRGIAYRPSRQIARVDAAGKRLYFEDGDEVSYDVLAVVPPHVPPAIVQEAGLTAPGWQVSRVGTFTRSPLPR